MAAGLCLAVKAIACVADSTGFQLHVADCLRAHCAFAMVHRRKKKGCVAKTPNARVFAESDGAEVLVPEVAVMESECALAESDGAGVLVPDVAVMKSECAHAESDGAKVLVTECASAKSDGAEVLVPEVSVMKSECAHAESDGAKVYVAKRASAKSEGAEVLVPEVAVMKLECAHAESDGADVFVTECAHAVSIGADVHVPEVVVLDPACAHAESVGTKVARLERRIDTIESKLDMIIAMIEERSEIPNRAVDVTDACCGVSRPSTPPPPPHALQVSRHVQTTLLSSETISRPMYSSSSRQLLPSSWRSSSQHMAFVRPQAPRMLPTSWGARAAHMEDSGFAPSNRFERLHLNDPWSHPSWLEWDY